MRKKPKGRKELIQRPREFSRNKAAEVAVAASLLNLPFFFFAAMSEVAPRETKYDMNAPAGRGPESPANLLTSPGTLVSKRLLNKF